MKKENIIHVLNICMFVYALLGVWLAVTWLLTPLNATVLLDFLDRKYLYVLLGSVFLVKTIDAILVKVYPSVRLTMYSSKALYDTGVFYFEFLILVFLLPISGNLIKILLYYICRKSLSTFIAKEIIKKRTPSG